MENRHILQLQAAPGIGIGAQRSVLDFVQQQGLTIRDYLKLSPRDWQHSGLSDQQASALTAQTTVAQAERWADVLGRQGIQIIASHDTGYPERLNRILGKLAPPVLAIWGNQRLLSQPAVGWCGSRHASDQGIAFTEDTVEQAAARGVTVVSGAAKGVDTAAHSAALSNGGTTVVVAAEGLLNFRLRSEIKELVTPTNTLVLSEFQPNARWSAANAMTRNHTIIGLSNALIVVESALTGGTFQAGQFALKIRAPLFVAEYTQPSERATGNAYFIQRGATPIQRDPETRRARVQPLFDQILVHYDELRQPPHSDLVQGVLFTASTTLNQVSATSNA